MAAISEFRDVAGFLWLALQTRQIEPDAVVTWADHVIAATSQPPIEIIDLSLSAGWPIQRRVDALGAMAKPISADALRKYASLLRIHVFLGKLTELAAAKILYSLTPYDAAEEVFGREIWCIDDVFDPWDRGPVGGAKFVRDFLFRFDDPLPISIDRD
jgi:hypothetical protein